MTERKPPGVSYGSWVDRQIAAAEARGDFEDLPGAGKPLPPPTGHDAATDWAIRRAREGDLDVAAFLPPALALPREIQDLPRKLAKVHAEGKVREIVEDLNARIRRAHAMPQDGPVLRARPLDVEETVASWRAGREDAS
ncbi:DUF1992 domain-containing protein [Amycolatopsis rubida]|uniref:DUF1992 domain-containing protein n=1 Tax=Amycolatopsis rubida TaxID=112413 RepID=A0ABX0C1Z7_9PSEU|nr:DUF1992 domain-containing protein [Amycolatopsis sp. M39]MYW96830.1 DUF1992 domain-containing protein [Amycolatopsis rubida]NEC61815.1 DUF1992 domain-containing protein [Amycolatopsis rubida]OAP25699.1 hypothetical protein A4R44_03074 [Amycolatopsis sp. M39]